MRIGLDYRPAVINREGIGRVARELVRALGRLEEAHEDELRLFGWTLAPRRFDRAELGLDVRRIKLSRLRFPSRWIPKLCARLGKGADDLVGGVDVWHHTQPSSLPVRSAVEVATIYDCIYLRDDGFLSTDAARVMERSVRDLIDRCALVIVPSAFIAADVERSLGVTKERIAVTHLGCDHVLRHAPRERIESREPFFLTVARVDPRKNHLRILHAFEALVRAGSRERWIVAGPPGHRADDFEQALARSPARERIDRRVDVGEKELAELYATCTAFVFPSLDEGFGLPPLEAMALGAPTIGSTSGSLPEVLGDAALLVDAHDENAIREAMKELAQDASKRASLSHAGREHASRFTWASCARATRAAYQRALEIGSRSSTG